MSSLHTHLKHFNPYTFILQKAKNTPYGFCNNLLFASATIIIFDGLFLDRISELLKLNLKWLRIPNYDPEIQKCRTSRDNQK